MKHRARSFKSKASEEADEGKSRKVRYESDVCERAREVSGIVCGGRCSDDIEELSKKVVGSGRIGGTSEDGFVVFRVNSNFFLGTDASFKV